MESQGKAAIDTPLIPFSEFKNITKKVLSVTKVESDRQLAEYQDNLQREREEKEASRKAA